MNDPHDYVADCECHDCLRVTVFNLKAGIAATLDYVEGEMQAAYNNAGPECCGRGVVGGEYMGSKEIVCCGNPEPAWSKEDQAVMDKLAPVQSRLHAMLSAAQAKEEKP